MVGKVLGIRIQSPETLQRWHLPALSRADRSLGKAGKAVENGSFLTGPARERQSCDNHGDSDETGELLCSAHF